MARESVAPLPFLRTKPTVEEPSVRLIWWVGLVVVGVTTIAIMAY
jgi:uncharacterized membrane protein SpoIIM required for sporulation